MITCLTLVHLAIIYMIACMHTHGHTHTRTHTHTDTHTHRCMHTLEGITQSISSEKPS